MGLDAEGRCQKPGDWVRVEGAVLVEVEIPTVFEVRSEDGRWIARSVGPPVVEARAVTRDGALRCLRDHVKESLTRLLTTCARGG